MRFRGDPSSLRGSIAPVVTPFTDAGELDLPGLRRLISWQLNSGSHGISLGGSTGEPSAQTAQERITAMTEAVAVIADRVPFLPGTGSARLDETLELTAAASELGADAALVITPYYARPTQEGLFQWYATVAGQNPELPIVVYNVPSRTAVDIAPETVARLRRRFDNIIGVKETTRDFEHFSRVLHQCGRDILVWSGIELLCLPLLALGGVGFVSAVANLAPAAVAQMFELWMAGEHEKARETALRNASPGGRDLHRDQPGTGQMGAAAGGPARLRLRPPAPGQRQQRRAAADHRAAAGWSTHAGAATGWPGGLIN